MLHTYVTFWKTNGTYMVAPAHKLCCYTCFLKKIGWMCPKDGWTLTSFSQTETPVDVGLGPGLLYHRALHPSLYPKNAGFRNAGFPLDQEVGIRLGM